ncbi:putative G-protein coupled receptor 34 [Merluccius polli]|uniref:Probable G-protein coupled receptor 34 n=1 Tax=Merluccius polli TaxID=89951 RepID=A0AA47MBM2_MERPO|nr:putative G-protein coupled receptor 34 [Merluccius polli]
MATPTSASPSSFTLTPSQFASAASAASNAPATSSNYTTSHFPGASSVTVAVAVCPYANQDLRLPLALLYSLFFLTGLAGNVLALWAFGSLGTPRGPGGGGRRHRHNSVGVLLINCAVADLVLVVCLPFRVYYHLNGNHWGLGSLACRLVGNLFYMNMYISILLLGLIGLDRCLRLSGKGAALKRGKGGRWTWVGCGVIWALSLAMLAPMVGSREGNEEAGQCFQYKQRRNASGKVYFNAVLVLLFWAIFVVLAVSYGCIAAQLLRVQRDKPELPNAGRYGRTARKSFFVLFLFGVCFGPYHAFRPVYLASQLDPALSCRRAASLDRTNEVMLLLSAFNSCLDPVMYFLLSGSVRKTAARVLGLKRLNFPTEMTSNSSTAEQRRLSKSVILPNTITGVGAGAGGGLVTQRIVMIDAVTTYNARDPSQPSPRPFDSNSPTEV